VAKIPSADSFAEFGKKETSVEVSFEYVKIAEIRIVGGGALDAPAVKCFVFYLLPANP